MGISALSWEAIRLSQTTSFHSLSHRCDIQSNPDFNFAVLTEKTTYWFLLLRIWFCLLLWLILLVLPPAFGKCHNQNRNYVASRQKCIFVIDINNFPSLEWLWFVKLSVPWNTNPVALADWIGGRHLTEVLPIAFSMDFHVVTKGQRPLSGCESHRSSEGHLLYNVEETGFQERMKQIQKTRRVQTAWNLSLEPRFTLLLSCIRVKFPHILSTNSPFPKLVWFGFLSFVNWWILVNWVLFR